MKLSTENKFILEDDDGNLILITEIEFDFNLLRNKTIPMKGIKFNVDYDKNIIEKQDEITVQTSFDIDCIFNT